MSSPAGTTGCSKGTEDVDQRELNLDNDSGNAHPTQQFVSILFASADLSASAEL
jgi:hypothetical protein